MTRLAGHLLCALGLHRWHEEGSAGFDEIGHWWRRVRCERCGREDWR